jgi:hypothetical protein
LAALPALVAILTLAIVFIVVGLITAGSVALLPTYWQRSARCCRHATARP